MIFINKLWNASRFVSTNLPHNNPLLREEGIEGIENEIISNYGDLMFHEKWILSRVKYLSDLVTDSMENYNFSEA